MMETLQLPLLTLPFGGSSRTLAVSGMEVSPPVDDAFAFKFD